MVVQSYTNKGVLSNIRQITAIDANSSILLKMAIMKSPLL
ncbi:hypothetical protein ND6B_3360 [Pseudoalteromonas sp. ND6B]|nr:hypothetical protein ND6B_3360 [Pseudoalteromonas sp. ND6B]